MEKDVEIRKLLNVLHRIARSANFAAWNNVGADAVAFCVSQYNKILNRLSALEPAVVPLFVPLSDQTPADVVRLAAGELSAFFEESCSGPRYQYFRARGCGQKRAWAGWAQAQGRRY